MNKTGEKSQKAKQFENDKLHFTGVTEIEQRKYEGG